MKKMVILILIMWVCLLFLLEPAVAVNYNVSGSDPEGDLEQHGGSVVPGHSEIDIKYVETKESGNDFIIILKVYGLISDASGINYQIGIKYGDDDDQGYSVYYGNGQATGTAKKMGEPGHSIDVVKKTDTLTFTESKDVLNTPTKWEVNAATFDLGKDGKLSDDDFYDSSIVKGSVDETINSNDPSNTEEKDDHDNTEEDNGIPGFEVLILLGAIGITIIVMRKRIRSH